MKRKIMFIGLLVLLAASGFMLLTDTREVDRELELAREYAKGYKHGYNAKFEDLEFEVEAWKRRYLWMLEKEVERWRADSKEL